MCVLRVAGKHFDVDAFIKKSKLEPCNVYHRGEPALRTKPRKYKCSQSGFTVSVSNASWKNFRRQIGDAIQFLTKNKAEISRLKKFAGVEAVVLDFPTFYNEKKLMQAYDFPVELIALAYQLRIGLWISEYPDPESKD